MFIGLEHFILFLFVSKDVVLIPKIFRARVAEMSNEEGVDLFHTGRYIGQRLEAHYGGTSLNFGIQDGPESGQSVCHTHMHILPRRKGDFRKDELYDKLREHDKDPRIVGRTVEQMTAEAAVLRKLFGYKEDSPNGIHH